MSRPSKKPGKKLSIIIPTKKDMFLINPAAEKGYEEGLKKVQKTIQRARADALTLSAAYGAASEDEDNTEQDIQTRRSTQKRDAINPSRAQNEAPEEAVKTPKETQEDPASDNDQAATYIQQVFLRGHVKIQSHESVQSNLLRGMIRRATHFPKWDKEHDAFGLSVGIDLRKLLSLNPNIGALPEIMDDPTASSLDFNQHRTTTFYVGEFTSMRAAQGYLYSLDQYLMHVLAEKGLHGTRLRLQDDFPVMELDPEAALTNREASEAVQISRLVDAFHTVNKGLGLNFRLTMGKIVRSVLEEAGLPSKWEESLEGEDLRVRVVFDRDIGHYEFFDEGPDQPARMVQTKFSGPSSQSKGHQAFNGEVTGETLTKHFIDRVVAAARERGTLNPENLETAGGKIKTIRDVPLYDRSGLGFLSPFADKGSTQQDAPRLH